MLVLLAYKEFHRQDHKIRMFLASLAALTFRQTNVFWVAIYLGGLEVVRNLKKGVPGVEYAADSTFVDVAVGSWQHGCLYDPLVSDACFEGRSTFHPAAISH